MSSIIFLFRNNSDQVLRRHAGRRSPPCDARRMCREWQNSLDQREAWTTRGQLHGDKRPIQLLLQLRNAAKSFGETIGKEVRQKLRSTWKQKDGLLSG